MRKFLLFFLLAAAASSAAHAQVERAYRDKLLTVDAGGFVSYFKPDFWTNDLAGVGAMVDVNMTPWLGIEAEARWLRFHQADQVHEDNYLVGLRYRPYQYGRTSVWIKGLIGAGEMNFPDSYAHGGYTDVALGAHVEYRMKKRITLRPIDFEYQYWPYFSGGAIHPWGVSTGLKYRLY